MTREDVSEVAFAAMMKQDVTDKNVVKTNADHIRSMTDEELAKAFDVTCPPGNKWKSCGECDFDESKKCWLDWLKQPYKEDT